MPSVIVQLPLDLTGRNPDNLMGSEEHLLTAIDGFPFKLITLYHGGFYTRDLRVYDAQYRRLKKDIDYICSYHHVNASQYTGLEICSVIVFLDPARTGTVFTSAQMVGGDLAFSFTAKTDYINFYNSTPGLVPSWLDYAGFEPTWKNGELVGERWGLDTYQPFNNEIESITRTVEGAVGTYEDIHRQKVRDRYQAFLDGFNGRLESHLGDYSNPHVVTKAQVSLGVVIDKPVATIAQAEAGISNAYYMTPALGFATVEKLAIAPLNAHLNITAGNPHGLTAEQLKAYRTTPSTTIYNSKYNKTEKVANSNNAILDGIKLSLSQVINNYRTNIPHSAFINSTNGALIGRMPQERLGLGTYSGSTVLRGDGFWVPLETIFSQYSKAKSGRIHAISAVNNNAQQTHNYIVATYPSTATHPVGEVFIYRVWQYTTWGTGNGAVSLGHWYDYMSIRTDAGWVLT